MLMNYLQNLHQNNVSILVLVDLAREFLRIAFNMKVMIVSILVLMDLAHE